MSTSATREGTRGALIDCNEVGEWAAAADVIVVGCGIAGVCAAIEAREGGAGAVLVLERASGCSNSTTQSGGHFYLGGGTAVQRACGFHDDAQALAHYLTAVTQRPDPAKIAAFAEGSAAHFDWLEAHGIPFDRSYFPTKAVMQEGRDCLIWTGNERVWPFCEQAHAAPRGHKVAFVGQEGGGNLAQEQLVKHAQRIGVEMQFDTRVDAVVVEGGRVIGVRARRFGRERHLRAGGGVVLATGGFGQNAAMLREYVPLARHLSVVGGPYDDGSGIRLGMAAGGAVEHMNGFLLTSPIYPPEQLVKGILVNRAGQRFVAEDSYHTRTSIRIAEQADGIAYLIVDADIFAYPAWHEHGNQRLVDGFETIAAMEASLEMPVGSLQRTMAEYSRHAAEGDDPELHKQPEWLKPLTTGPWAAFDFSYGRAKFYGFTLGGLRISAAAEVLDERGDPVAGLYAAGACASMLAHDSLNYASGISLSAGSFFGRRAGRHASGRG